MTSFAVKGHLIIRLYRAVYVDESCQFYSDSEDAITGFSACILVCIFFFVMQDQGLMLVIRIQCYCCYLREHLVALFAQIQRNFQVEFPRDIGF